jgi:tetratricopeptide (TPR) repeat protein
MASIRAGMIAESKGSIERAEQHYQDALKNGGGNDARVLLIHLLLKKNALNEAKKMIDEHDQSANENDEILFERGMLMMLMGDQKGAEKLFDSKSAMSSFARYGLIVLSIQKADHDKAKEQLKMMVANEKDITLKNRASLLLQAYEEFALFEHGESIHRDTLLARALAEVDECVIALPLLDSVVKQKDQYRDAWTVKGYCELMNGAPKNALASLEQAYGIDPTKPEIQYFLARTYFSLGDPQNAVTFLQYALANGFEPRRDAQTLLVEYAEELGNTDLALEQMEQLLKETGLSPEVLTKFESSSITSPERATRALITLDILLKKNPDSLPLLIATLKCARVAENQEKVKEISEKIQLIDPKNAVL